jgi:acyl-CoA dehydrogenase
MDFKLTAAQSALRQRAREFARQEVAPRAAGCDRAAAFPWDLYHRARERGLLHLTVPAQAGGAGLGVLEQVLVCEELAWGCAGICAALNLNTLAIAALTTGGTPAQCKEYLPRILGGELFSFALTEPGAGSDVTALRATARPTGTGGYVLDGHKAWISNAPGASVFLVFARVLPAGGPAAAAGAAAPAAAGIGAFLVERGADGLAVGPPLGIMGQRALPAAEVFLHGVEVDACAMLGPGADGLALAASVFSRSRPLIAAYGTGLTQRCLDEATGHAGQRLSMGRRIIEHQAVGQKIADMGMRVAAARLLAYQAAWLCDSGEPSPLQAAYAKTFAADTAMSAATETLQVFGSRGYSTAQPIEKLFRDAKLLQIYEGTQEINRLLMTRELARSSPARPAAAPAQPPGNTQPPGNIQPPDNRKTR